MWAALHRFLLGRSTTQPRLSLYFRPTFASQLVQLAVWFRSLLVCWTCFPPFEAHLCTPCLFGPLQQTPLAPKLACNNCQLLAVS